MASPPYRSPATSPPYPHHISLPNPKKRPSLSLTAHPPPSKKRKPSSLAASTPNSSHPLRQTSFPPEGSATDLGARSPSIESDVTGITGVTAGRSVSVVTGKGVKAKGKRKRGEDDESVKKGKAGKVGAENTPEDVPEEEEDDEGDMGVMEGTEEDKEQERKSLAILIEAFNPDQAERYDLFRRLKLKKETVRKIVNQTLSQSVPPSVITSINAYTKIFIGNLVERARDMQEQHASLPSPPPEDAFALPQGTTNVYNPSHYGTDLARPHIKSEPSPNDHLDIETNPFAQLKEYASPSSPLKHSPSPSPGAPMHSTRQFPEQSTQNPKFHKELGPLLPDHLREALRRYRRAGEGGGVGMGGLSLVELGVPGVASARLGGRRLFR